MLQRTRVPHTFFVPSHTVQTNLTLVSLGVVQDWFKSIFRIEVTKPYPQQMVGRNRCARGPAQIPTVTCITLLIRFAKLFVIILTLQLVRVAAVSCSSTGPRFRWDGIWVWDDGQAGSCMGGTWHRCMASVHGAGWMSGGVVYLCWLILCPFHTMEYVSFGIFLKARWLNNKAHSHFCRCTMSKRRNPPSLLPIN